MEAKHYHLIVIGGGAAGIAAALTAAAFPLKVAILEKKEALGKKLRATGNGRCNLSNVAIPTADKTQSFFEALGIPTRVDDAGRIYPFSESAASVVDTLTLRLKQAGVHRYCDSPVSALTKEGGVFHLTTPTLKATADAVILATGGKAGPAYGCTGDGYTLAKGFGHRVTKTIPVLSGVMCKPLAFSLKGIRAKGMLTLRCENHLAFMEEGEVQFTDYGISGICAFNLSRHLHYLGDQRLEPYTITLDLAPGQDFLPYLTQRAADPAINPTPCGLFLEGVVKKGLASVILHQAAILPTTPLGQCRPEDLNKMAEALHGLSRGFWRPGLPPRWATPFSPEIHPCPHPGHALYTGRRAGAAAANKILRNEE